MGTSESTNVFVSYSRADAALVSPVVKLLRVNKSFVFQDIDHIQPGKRWQGEIAKALTESNLVVVFWCTHANRSNAVSQEWQAAIEQKKDLLPLLLDPTPLPPQLAEFQWIDFRGTVGAQHSSMDLGDRPAVASEPPQFVKAAAPTSVPRSARWLLLTAAAAVFVTAAVFLGPFFLQRHAAREINAPSTLTPAVTPASTAIPYPHPSPSVKFPRKPPYPPPSFPRKPPSYAPSARLPKASPMASPMANLLLLGIVVAVLICLMWLLERRQKRMKSIKSSKRLPGDIERHIAGKVEAEILRRTSLSRGEGR